MADAKQTIRRRIRAQRRELDLRTQAASADAVAATVLRWAEQLTPGVAAATVATDGELSPRPIVDELVQRGWKVAYPRIADDAMAFHLSEPAQMVEGELGLIEPPADAPVVDPTTLELVLVPLVAFDARCNRMGRGKAYYDRAFAFLGSRERPSRPVMIGLAHSLQRVASLPVEAHDVVLDAVVTPDRVYGSLISTA